MKKFILSISVIIFFSFTFSSNPPGWFIQYTPTNGRLINDIYFLDSLNGWAVTDFGSGQDTCFILKTTSGGNNWQVSFPSISYIFYDIKLFHNDIGYVIGAHTGTGNSLVLKTTNGGQNWFETNFPSGNPPLDDMSFVNSDIGWVCSQTAIFGGLWRTTNGGQNWNAQAGGDISNVFFVNENTGWYSAYTSLYKTTNSGINWNMQYNFTSSINDLFFVYKDTGWIFGGGGGSGLNKTINGGNNWMPQVYPGAFSDGKLFFLDNKRGWLGNGGFFKILVSKDGQIWGTQTTPAPSTDKLFFIDTLNGWGSQTRIIHTIDGGGPITYTGIRQTETFIPSFELYQNYPNPFNPKTVIKFELLKNSTIDLSVHDVTGKEIAKLIDGEYFNTIGTQRIEFSADKYNLSTGIYFYTVEATTEDKKEIFVDTKKMILIK